MFLTILMDFMVNVHKDLIFVNGVMSISFYHNYYFFTMCYIVTFFELSD